MCSELEEKDIIHYCNNYFYEKLFKPSQMTLATFLHSKELLRFVKMHKLSSSFTPLHWISIGSNGVWSLPKSAVTERENGCYQNVLGKHVWHRCGKKGNTKQTSQLHLSQLKEKRRASLSAIPESPVYPSVAQTVLASDPLSLQESAQTECHSPSWHIWNLPSFTLWPPTNLTPSSSHVVSVERFLVCRF